MTLFGGLMAMIAVTYLPRAIPLIFMRRELKSPWFKAFLEYVPYAVLVAMTLPAIFTSTRSLESAAAGLLTAFSLSLSGRSLMSVSIGAAAAVCLVEILQGYPFI